MQTSPGIFLSRTSRRLIGGPRVYSFRRLFFFQPPSITIEVTEPPKKARPVGGEPLIMLSDQLVVARSNKEVEVGDDGAVAAAISAGVFLVLELDDVAGVDGDDDVAIHARGAAELAVVAEDDVVNVDG